MDANTRLVLIRHGCIAGNEGGPPRYMSGWADLPLSPAGRRQIEQLAEALSTEPAFDALYSSPLKRAYDTAQALAGRSNGRIQTLQELKEIRCGSVDGLLIEDVKTEYRDLWESNQAQSDEHFRWPGGESYREFRMRCLGAVEKIALRHPGRRVAIVTHAGVINQIVGWLRGASPAQWEPFRPDNVSLTEIDWSDRSGVLVAFNRHPAGAGP